MCLLYKANDFTVTIFYKDITLTVSSHLIFLYYVPPPLPNGLFKNFYMMVCVCMCVFSFAVLCMCVSFFSVLWIDPGAPTHARQACYHQVTLSASKIF